MSTTLKTLGHGLSKIFPAKLLWQTACQYLLNPLTLLNQFSPKATLTFMDISQRIYFWKVMKEIDIYNWHQSTKHLKKYKRNQVSNAYKVLHIDLIQEWNSTISVLIRLESKCELFIPIITNKNKQNSEELKESYPAPNETLWWLTLPPISARSNPHNMRVDSTWNTVLHLHVQLRKSVFYKLKQKSIKLNNIHYTNDISIHKKINHSRK